MRFVAILRHRLRALFLRAALERELDEEIRYHFERQMEEQIANGLAPDEARRVAERAALGLEARKEECRDVRGLNIIDNLWRDLRFASRQLRNAPAFTCVAVAVLALGLSAVVAIFAYVDAALIKPLPYPDAAALMTVTESGPVIPVANLSYQDYLDWKRSNTVLQSFDVYTSSGFLLDTADGAEPISGGRVSDGFFRTLGVRPILGRDFHPGEASPSAARTVILSYQTWQTRFNGSKNVYGQKVMLSGIPHVVIGVLPREFHFAPAGPLELWTTIDGTGGCEKRRSCHNLVGIARLKTGISREAALANLQSIAAQLERQYPDSNRGQGAVILPLTETIVGQVQPVLKVLIAGAGLLLLIACVNIASLLLVRAERRRREIMLRGALGASGGRLFAQFAIEAVLLVLAGGAVGLLGASWAMQFLLKLIPADMLADMPYLAGLQLNARITVFAMAALVIAVAVFSAVPALHVYAARMAAGIASGLAEGSRGSAGLAWQRIGSKLVVLEFAAVLVLLAGAGFLGKSLHALLRVETGFRPERLATMNVIAPRSAYQKPDQVRVLHREIVDAVRQLPGVESVATTSLLPVSFNGNTDWIRFVGRPYNGQHNEVNQREVSIAYFDTIGARLLRGRKFNEADEQHGRRIVIINRKLATQYFPGQDPIGQQIGDTELTPASLKEIVGVIDDIHEGSLDAEIWPAVYYPFHMDPSTSFSVVARTGQNAAAMLGAMRSAIRTVHPDAGMMDETTMEQRIRMSPIACFHRSAAWLVGCFAALALLVSVLGLYGVVAYAVDQRTREIGVRMALGATPVAVTGMILREVMVLSMTAVTIGLAGSLAASRFMRGFFYEVGTMDAPLLAVATGVLIAVAMLASYLPARRAALVNPVEALRTQ